MSCLEFPAFSINKENTFLNLELKIVCDFINVNAQRTTHAQQTNELIKHEIKASK